MYPPFIVLNRMSPSRHPGRQGEVISIILLDSHIIFFKNYLTTLSTKKDICIKSKERYINPYIIAS